MLKFVKKLARYYVLHDYVDLWHNNETFPSEESPSYCLTLFYPHIVVHKKEADIISAEKFKYTSIDLSTDIYWDNNMGYQFMIRVLGLGIRFAKQTGF